MFDAATGENQRISDYFIKLGISGAAEIKEPIRQSISEPHAIRNQANAAGNLVSCLESAVRINATLR
jgi:hypothetical protein